jgi:hypothetical protein
MVSVTFYSIMKCGAIFFIFDKQVDTALFENVVNADEMVFLTSTCVLGKNMHQSLSLGILLTDYSIVSSFCQ